MKAIVYAKDGRRLPDVEIGEPRGKGTCPTCGSNLYCALESYGLGQKPRWWRFHCPKGCFVRRQRVTQKRNAPGTRPRA